MHAIKISALLTGLAVSTHSPVLEAYIGAACMGELLWSYDIDAPGQNCTDVTKYPQSNSIHVGAGDKAGVVYFYNTTDCSGDYTYRTTETICYVEPDDDVKSFIAVVAV